MKKYKSFVVCGFCLTLALCGCTSSDLKEVLEDEPLTAEQKEFDAYLEEQLIETLEGDYYTMHSLAEDPSSLGIDLSVVEKTWGRFDAKTMEEDRAEVEETLAELESFSYEDLTSAQQDTYDTFVYQMKTSQELSDERFDYIASLFSPMTGIQVSFPTIFSDWELYTKQDAQDLVLMMQDVDDYIQSALDYTYIQEEKGMLCLSFEEIRSYCQQILSQGNESSVLDSLKEEVDELDLSGEESESLQNDLETAYQDSYLKGYQMILDAMDDLEQNGENHPSGLASFASGKEYYTALMHSQIGSMRSVEEVQEMMASACQEHLNTAMELSDAAMGIYFLDTGYQDYEEILDDVQKKMKDDFPEISEKAYQIQDMEEDIATDNGVAAYYQIPTLDGDQTGQLRVNPLNDGISSIDTYMTVCHEGMPGHMYQYNYTHENLDQPVRWSLLANPAYQEGYATYVEHYVLRYLDEDARMLKFYSEYMLSIYDALILADIGIHYENWDSATCAAQMEAYGLSMTQEQYDQLLYTPCAFEPYYVGYEEIALYRSQAKEKAGEDFSELDFHTVLLEAGAASFDVIQRHMDSYIGA